MPIAPIRLRPSTTSSGIFASRSIRSGSTSFSRNVLQLGEEALALLGRLGVEPRLGMDQVQAEVAEEEFLAEARQLPFLLARGLGDLPGLALAHIRRGHPLITAQLRARARRLNRPHAPDPRRHRRPARLRRPRARRRAAARDRRRPDPARRRPAGRRGGGRVGRTWASSRCASTRCGRGSRPTTRRATTSGRRSTTRSTASSRPGWSRCSTITGPGPLWVSRRSERGEPRYDPDPKLYGEFARAVAERYGDRVDRYILWNEPNLGGWLRPQASCNRHELHAGRAAPVPRAGPRRLPRGPRRRPGRAGADRRAVLARRRRCSRENANQRPLAFLRAFGCVDAELQEAHAPAAAGASSRRPRTASRSTRTACSTAPETAFPHPDDVALASLSQAHRARSTGSSAAAALKATTRRFDLYLDEFGYQTNPPDKLAGISLTQQDQWLQRAAYQAWRNPRVKLFSQYLWRDEPRSAQRHVRRLAVGPALHRRPRQAERCEHFTTPFVLDAARGRLWGQVRRRDTRHASRSQRRLRGSSRWRTVDDARTPTRRATGAGPRG